MITIAIGKGRMQESALALLARAGIRLNDGVNSRRLIAPQGRIGPLVTAKPLGRKVGPLLLDHLVCAGKQGGRDR